MARVEVQQVVDYKLGSFHNWVEVALEVVEVEVELSYFHK